MRYQYSGISSGVLTIDPDPDKAGLIAVRDELARQADESNADTPRLDFYVGDYKVHISTFVFGDTTLDDFDAAVAHLDGLIAS